MPLAKNTLYGLMSMNCVACLRNRRKKVQVGLSEMSEILENYLQDFQTPSFRICPICISLNLGDVGNILKRL